MTDPREPGDLPEISEAYRRTPAPDAAARARLAARLSGEPPPRRGWVWISPAGALSLRPAAAAALALLLLVAGYALGWIPGLAGVAGRAPVAATGTPDVAGRAPVAATATPDAAGRDGSTSGPASVPAERIVEFVFMASGAASVSVVGDFNDWDPERTPMRRVDPAGTWVARVPLAEGRRVYAFVVDGDRWVADPDAPLAPTEEFGAPRSVVVVSGSGI